MKNRKSQQPRRRLSLKRVRAHARDAALGLSREWIQEIERRARDSRDPVRYMLVSEFSRNFILYYDVSGDVFAMNSPEKGTLFKRREAAERVASLLSRGVRIIKLTTKGGKLRRLTPFQGPSWARPQPNSRSNGRAASTVAKTDVGLARRSPRR